MYLTLSASKYFFNLPNINLNNTNDDFKRTVQEAWQKIQDAIQRVWNMLQPTFQKVQEVIQKVWKAIEPLVELLGTVLVNIIVNQVELWSWLMEILIPIIDILVAAIGVIADKSISRSLRIISSEECVLLVESNIDIWKLSTFLALSASNTSSCRTSIRFAVSEMVWLFNCFAI